MILLEIIATQNVNFRWVCREREQKRTCVGSHKCFTSNRIELIC